MQNMRTFRYFTLPLAACLLLLAACVKPEQPDPAPAGITLSAESIRLPAEGSDSQTLTVTAPFRPVVSGVPSWINWTEGAYEQYKISYTFSVGANSTYASREAVITLQASSLSKTFRITQAGAERPVTPTPTLEPAPESGAGAGRKMADHLGLGWNMGNQLDGYYSGSWAGALEGYPGEVVWQPGSTDAEKAVYKATQATLDGVKAAGFRSIRLPVSWLRMIGPAPDYKIDAAWMARVAEIVGYARQAGLYVIINTHHDENHGTDNTWQWLDIKKAARDAALNETIKAEIKAVWTQIAEQFKDCGDWLVMEGFNELNDGGWGWSEEFRADPTKQCNILNEWNQVFVSTVRATGGNNATRWLGVPTYAANPQYIDYFELPKDPAGKTMVAVHFYDPSEYTIGEKQYSDWGHTGDAAKKEKGDVDEEHVKKVFGKLSSTYVDKDIPVYLGEFGCSRRKKSDNRAWSFYKYYMEYIVKAARTYNIPCFVWDNGTTGTGREQHGLIHHGTGEYIGTAKEIVELMNKAWYTADSAYTLQSVYDNAPKF